MSGPYREESALATEITRTAIPSVGPFVRAYRTSDGRLVVERRAARRVRGTRLGVFAVAVAFVVTIPVSLVSPSMAYAPFIMAGAAWVVENRFLRVVDALELGPNGLAWDDRGSRKHGLYALEDVVGVEPIFARTFDRAHGYTVDDCSVRVLGKDGSVDVFGSLEKDDDRLKSAEVQWVAELLNATLRELRASAPT